MDQSAANGHPVRSRDEWLIARKALLAKEKEFTRAKDKLTRMRGELPWVRIEKNYLFDGPDGKQSLAELFDGRSQLIVQHFMLGPGWQEGCVGCSFLADHADAARRHLVQHDVDLVVASRAPWQEIEPFKKRMGWLFPWVSAYESDFNSDFNVSFTDEQRAAGKAYSNYAFGDPGINEIGGHSVFFKDADGRIFHTYSTFNRGDETLIGTYSYLDLMPLGRNERGKNHDLTDWVRHHDRYNKDGHE
ncbi:MAG: DUF899 domain-containing protein [Armatimonadetes bacterium]|nr:DUF899 domain-containing protein [Akkermansiaceae bacterium]